MAESILANIAQGIIVQLGAAAVKEIASLWHVEEELETLRTTITTIKGALANAEKQQSEDEQVRILLERLEDAVYEADDLVDEFSTEALRRQVMTPGNNKMAKKVRTFFSPSNQIVFRHKMNQKIKDIRNKLEGVAADKRFQFETTSLCDTNKAVPVEWEHSFVGEDEVMGRDVEKMDIIKQLFDTKTEENLGVIPIFGVGGLGKTTLAKLVFNDEVVQQQFELKMWVSVPKLFDVQVIVKDIIKSGGKHETSIENDSMDELQKKIREKINGKRYFLVLDDVWEESRENWLKLEKLLKNGADGSRIIVTTRSRQVADIVVSATMKAYDLGELSDAKSWDLFKKKAFKPGKEPEENILNIGEEILKKCGGNPLVIGTIGSMLYSMDPEEWSSFKEKELSRASIFEQDIIPRLRLSYDRLPSHLKHCFAYCSMFPKNYEIDVQQLIKLWMAQGFIKLSDSHHRPEDMGYQNFKALLWRSFFQEVDFDDFSNNVTSCKMHDCMHDLAMSVAGTGSVILSLNGHDDSKVDKRTRHVTFDIIARGSRQQFPTSTLVRATRIRSILFAHDDFVISWELTSKMIDGLFNPLPKFLRTLDLDSANIKKLPNSIGKLKHLRYLDLSRNYRMEALPNSIERLQNLQTLNLSCCLDLRVLPKGITKLVNLRHLETFGCRSLTHMPRGLAQLRNLQTLSKFVMNADTASGSGELNELENLNNLRGELEIVVKKDGIQTKAANLKAKQYLQSLKLVLDGTIVADDCEGFLPHPNLREFSLIGDHIHLRMLNYVPSLTNLVKFSIWGHKECQHLPPMNHLRHLKVLSVEECSALEYISSNDDDNFFSSTSSSSSTFFFPSLQELILRELPTLKRWWKYVSSSESDIISSIPSFSCLSKLAILGCPQLISIPLCPYLEDLELSNTSFHIEQNLMMINVGGGQTSNEALSVLTSSTLPATGFLPLSKLTRFEISRMRDLQCLPELLRNLTSLQKLRIWECRRLQSLSPGIRHLTSLQNLQIIKCMELDMCSDIDATMWGNLGSLRNLALDCLPKLVALPEGLQHVSSLQKIFIADCNNLVDILECISGLKSLECLSIAGCPALKSLPEGIDCLPSLQSLIIQDCPILVERCQEDIRDYWPKICHIQNLQVYNTEEYTIGHFRKEHPKHDQQEYSTSSRTGSLFNCAKLFKH